MIAGIDPGQSGGIAFIEVDGSRFEVYKMPETPWEVHHLLGCSGHYGISFAYLERVGPMPKQGIASTAKFMRHVGVIEGILTALRIPFEEVTPQKWQRAMGCLTRGDKNISKRKAQQLWPDVKFTHATADAALIAEYGRRKRFASPEDR